MNVSLIVTAYERADALAAVLHTVRNQSMRPHEVIIADDGSGAAVCAVIAEYVGDDSRACAVSQEHQGFRVARLRNLALARATGDYVVFIDGDMALDADFLRDHREFARSGNWVQGVRIPLDTAATARFIANPVTQVSPWARGLGSGTRALRRSYSFRSSMLRNALPRAGNGFVAVKSCNQGFWRSDLVAANGFNEAFEGWGPEDKELCARLDHAGVARRTLLFGGLAYHLHHTPATRERVSQNVALLHATLANRSTRCARGLDRHTV